METLFSAVKQPQGYWLSENFKHFVLANADSEGGQKYNEKTIVQIRAMIKGANADAKNDVLGTIISKTEKLLSKVLIEHPSGDSKETVKESAPEYLSWFQTIKAYISPNPHQRVKLSPENPVNVKLTVESLAMDKGQTLWFICPKTPLASNVSLSRNLKFAPDGSVYVDYSSQFVPNLRVVRLTNGDIQIGVECPSCGKSYTISTRGQSVVVRGEKTNAKVDGNHEYFSTNRLGQFEIEVPIGTLEKNYVYDIRKTAIEHVYENGVIILTVRRLFDDEEL